MDHEHYYQVWSPFLGPVYVPDPPKPLASINPAPQPAVTMDFQQPPLPPIGISLDSGDLSLSDFDLF